MINQKDRIEAAIRHIQTSVDIDPWAMELAVEALKAQLPSAQPEQHEIGYSECANAMLKMWIDNVLTDGEYGRIMDKLNAHWAERREE